MKNVPEFLVCDKKRKCRFGKVRRGKRKGQCLKNKRSR